MTMFQTLRRFHREAGTIPRRTRSGRPDGHAPAAITPRTVDGWYNFHADTMYRIARR